MDSPFREWPAVQWRRRRSWRADQAPGWCRAGGGLLRGKGPTGRLFLLSLIRVLLPEHGLLLFRFQFRQHLLEILAQTQPGQIAAVFQLLDVAKTFGDGLPQVSDGLLGLVQLGVRGCS
jgi:hypothetical protein